MLQIKKQGKNTKDQINEEEIGNLPETEFRVVLVKMIQDLETEWRHGLKNKKCLTAPRGTEETTTNDEQHNNWNEKYTGLKESIAGKLQ